MDHVYVSSARRREAVQSLLRLHRVVASCTPWPRPGDVVAGKYVLRQRLGAGGMGTVFLADHPALARCVAIKILHPHLAADAMFKRRFQDEAIAASRVRHRGTVAVLDSGITVGGAPFIAMEIVPGRPLGQILNEQVIPLRRGLAIFDQILAALDAAHACAVFHGDVKCDNFLVEQQADGDVVTLIDFGLARLADSPTCPGILAGTPEYLAPELVRGAPPTSASDLYGAGIILYELLTGMTPFAGGSTDEILRRQVEEEVIPPSLRRPDREIPAALDEIVLHALAKDPRDRFASAQELRDQLAALVIVAVRRRRAPARRRPSAAPSAGAAAPLHLENPPPAPSRSRFARGSETGLTNGGELRRAIASALVRGAVSEIAEGYAALAAELARERQLVAAIRELEEGIDVVSGGRGATGAEPPEAVSRLVAALAALYDLVGQPDRARRVLACADGRVTLVEMSPDRGGAAAAFTPCNPKETHACEPRI